MEEMNIKKINTAKAANYLWKVTLVTALIYALVGLWTEPGSRMWLCLNGIADLIAFVAYLKDMFRSQRSKTMFVAAWGITISWILGRVAGLIPENVATAINQILCIVMLNAAIYKEIK